LRVALIQMDIALGRPDLNRATATDRVREAAQDADLVILPEMWTTGYALADLAGNLADQGGEPTGAILAGLAHECGVYLVGSVADQRDGRIYNSATVYAPDGSRVAEYSKAHLVPMMDEHLYLAPGQSVTLAEIAGVKAGLAICYDLRFPELFRTMALGGAELLIIPAEWPAQRLQHWRLLLQARAIENQCFVLACNRVGKDLNNTFPGHSMVIDPWGAILAEGGDGEEILRAQFDPALVSEIRARIPVFRDRRPDLYRLE